MALGVALRRRCDYRSVKHLYGQHMSRLLLFAIAVSVSIPIFSVQTASQERPAGKKAARMRMALAIRALPIECFPRKK